VCSSDLSTVGAEAGMEARIARLESDVAHIRTDIAEVKTDLRRLDTNVDNLNHTLSGKIDSLKDDVASREDLGAGALHRACCRNVRHDGAWLRLAVSERLDALRLT